MISPLQALHSELDGLWESGLNKNEFLAKLINHFDESRYYVDTTEDGEILYFIALTKLSEAESCFWLLYVNKKYRAYTKNLLDEVAIIIRADGYKSVSFTTSNTSQSYERWVKKFGAVRESITFKITV